MAAWMATITPEEVRDRKRDDEEGQPKWDREVPESYLRLPHLYPAVEEGHVT